MEQLTFDSGTVTVCSCGNRLTELTVRTGEKGRGVVGQRYRDVESTYWLWFDCPGCSSADCLLVIEGVLLTQYETKQYLMRALES